eukprot:scaffold3735_cov82-Cyclotella_meneghiniana.AAC.7
MSSTAHHVAPSPYTIAEQDWAETVTTRSNTASSASTSHLASRARCCWLLDWHDAPWKRYMPQHQGMI